MRDLPWTMGKLRILPHFEFENWAVIALGGIPNKTQVGGLVISPGLANEPTHGAGKAVFSP